MAQVPTGSTFFVASVIAAQQATTVVTNATEAVVTCAAHGYANGDFVIMYSGWGRLQKRAFRIKAVAANNFTLEGCDTASTVFFPVGTGVGFVAKVTTWTQITTIMNPSSSGGEPKSVEYKFIESEISYQINDGFSATSYSLEMDADSIGTPGYTALVNLTNVQTDTVLRIITRSGSIILVPCTAALNEAISFTDGQINRVRAQFSGNNRAVRYVS
jgi:hypothetical protein